MVAAAGDNIHLYGVRSGIVQGCVLSGAPLAWASSPFLVDLALRVDSSGRGVIRACADDFRGLYLARSI
eukprot:2016889-Pyramimonas_sp.AAC.1